MVLNRKSFCTFLMAFALVLVPVFPQRAVATPQKSATSQHAVSPADLQKDIAASAAGRQANEAAVEKFFASAPARAALKKTGVNYEIVQQAVPLLSSAELAQLAARSEAAQKQFEAGALTNQQLTYIIIALATAVIVILIVEH